MELKKDGNKAEKKECKKTAGHMMEPQKGQKQGRDERTQEDFLTSAKYAEDVQ